LFEPKPPSKIPKIPNNRESRITWVIGGDRRVDCEAGENRMLRYTMQPLQRVAAGKGEAGG
jgi:hypothetical protein